MSKIYDLEFCEHANECKDYCPYICDETCSWESVKPFTVEPNSANDGMLDYKNAKTLKRYRELCDERDKCDIPSFGCFFAFSDKQFAEGLKTIRPLEEGEKLVRFMAGGYGTKEGVKQLVTYYKDMRERIANECQPYEIYCYEYNNHESFMSLDGDMVAIMVIVHTFGVETAKKIQRFSPVHSIHSIDELLKDEML